MRKKAIVTSIFFVGLFAGVFFGIRISQNTTTKAEDEGSPPLRIKDETLDFVHPLLTCSIPDRKEFNEFLNLESKIQNIITKEKELKKASEISVYYRDLDRGKWFGINEAEKYIPASLLKVSLMIAYFKQAENNPKILQEKLYYDGSFDDNKIETIEPSEKIKANQSYSIEDLIRFMVVNSDNNASHLLFNRLNRNLFNEIYTDLSLPIPSSKEPFENMNAKSYSLFFRVLYNSTYLSRELSSRALSLLTKSDFSRGLRSGIPQDVTIAHKFGEATVTFADGFVDHHELHDCGIVYSKNPFFICIMTKGDNFQNLESSIANIAKGTWDFHEAN